MKLMEKIKGRALEGILNADVLLRDQFIEHVCDGFLRRELKRFIRRQPTVMLIEVRKEAIRWEREGMPEGPRARNYSLPSSGDGFYGLPVASCAATRGAMGGGSLSQEFTELKNMLRQQQSQINQLTQRVAALQGPSRRVGPSRDGPVICWCCQRPGHYA